MPEHAVNRVVVIGNQSTVITSKPGTGTWDLTPVEGIDMRTTIRAAIDAARGVASTVTFVAEGKFFLVDETTEKDEASVDDIVLGARPFYND